MADPKHEGTRSVISTEKVAGTLVLNPEGDKLGTVIDLMIDKRHGKVAYAVMSFGGFLGIGEKYHPLPWSKLNYDVEREAYIVDIPREQLEGAPQIERHERERLLDPVYGESIHTYYNVPPFWL